MLTKLALAQYPVNTHSSFENWQSYTARWVEEAIGENARILVFPEYGSMELVSLFSPEIQADLHGQIRALQEKLPAFLETYRSLTLTYNCVIVAPSFPVETASGLYVNRAYVFGPKGEGYQDKWFMTRFEKEEWGIAAGQPELTIFETDGLRFGVQICYDIEFPIGSQLLAEAGAELIVVPSCTETIRGATRVHIGARARAMEQQVYTGVAQTINEALWSPAVDINYGYAAVYSSPDKALPEEGILSCGTPEKTQWLYTELNTSLNTDVRNDGQVFNYKDMQRLTITSGQQPVIKKITV